MDWDTKLFKIVLINLVFEHKRMLQSNKVDQNKTCIGFKPKWVDAHVNNFLTIQARDLKFCVCYLRAKSAPLINFQPNWTTRSKVTNFCHFICRVSLSIVWGGYVGMDRLRRGHISSFNTSPVTYQCSAIQRGLPLQYSAVQPCIRLV